MKIIREKIVTSDFGEKESEIFVYLSEKKSNKVLYILKGMYGIHRPAFGALNELKWDNKLVNYCSQDVNVVCLITSHKKISNEDNREEKKNAYDGKTFDEEIVDIQKVVVRVKDILYEQGVSQPEFYFFGKSFGGTLLLALKDSLEARALFMVGSGCGKSSTTTKSLLKTMPEENVLLKNISAYKNGKVYFFRGELDDVVPKDSQEKIVNALQKNIIEYTVVPGVDHEFEKVNGVKSDIPLEFLLQKVREGINEYLMVNGKE